MSNFPTKVTDRDEGIDETDIRKKAADSEGQIPKEMASKAPLGSLENPYKLGERGSGVRSQGAVQDFHTLREKYHEAGMLFEDPEFPADDTSIFPAENTSKSENEEIIWKRPKDLVDNPQLYVKGISRFDAKQGSVGNCWMVSALANLAMDEKLVYQVVPQDQSFDEKYAGIFHFRFWQSGKWVEVVIDDRLPMCNGYLLSIYPQDRNEFWAPLVEKAYAKLNGFYQALNSGFNSEALEDFTGGIARLFVIKSLPSNFFDVLLEAQDETILMGCIIMGPGEFTKEILEEHGLYTGHAYSLTKVMYYEKTVGDQVEKIPLLRVRNPWGSDSEWKGAWSEGSPEWESIPEDKKKELGFVAAPDGEFWISYEDWKKYFTYCEICYLSPSSGLVEDNKINCLKNWHESSFDGEWVIGSSAGGSIADLEKFQHNPQYLITLEKASKIIVALMQKNHRTNRVKVDYGVEIGFHIYELPKHSAFGLPKPLDLSFFITNRPWTSNEPVDPETGSSYRADRQVTCMTSLQPGSYCIVVSTSSTDKAGEYLLRVFSEKSIKIEEYDVEVGSASVEKMIVKESDEDELISLKVFRKLAGDDWEFDWKEEKEFLDNKLRKGVSEEGFSDDFCRSMVTLLDADDSGKISYHEFKIFWYQVITWRDIFKKYDEDGSGKLKPFQLRKAFEGAGYSINYRISNLFQRRYGDKDGYVKFHDYIMCLARFEKMISTFKEVSSGEMNSANVTLLKWIKMASNFA